MTLRLGTVCLFENPSNEAGRALIRQFVLAREADRMGYDDIWIAEHHGDPYHPSGAITALMGHLAGVTSKARIGAILQLKGRDVTRLVEDLATCELLSRARLALAADALGDASGLAVDAMAAVRDDLGGNATDLVPRPSIARFPASVVTDREDAVRRAATLGLGLWLPPALTLAAVSSLLDLYRAVARDAGTAELKPLLTRYACPAATHDKALAIARPYLEARLGAGSANVLLAESLVGSYAEVAAQIQRIEAEFDVQGVMIVPMSAQFDTAKHILADMVDEVRPLLDD